MKSYLLTAVAVAAAVAFGYENPLTITDAAVTSLTDEQKTALNNNTYDALIFNNGKTVEVTGIGSFNGDIVIKSGSVMKGSGTACVGTSTGKTIVEDGGSFFYYRTAKSDLPASPNNEKYEIAGNGCGDYGALYFSYYTTEQSDQNNAVFADVTLTAPAKVSSPNTIGSGRFHVLGKLNQNGHKLTCACGEPSFNPSTWTNPGIVETTCGYFHTGAIWNSVRTDDCKLIWNGGNWSVYGAAALEWPVEMKKSGTLSIGRDAPTSPSSTVNNFKGLFTLDSGVTLTIGDWSKGAGRVYFSGGLAGSGTITGNFTGADMCRIGDVKDSITVANIKTGGMRVYGKITDTARITAADGTIYVDGTENDYTGKTTISGGKVVFKGDGAFPVNGFTAETAASRLSISSSACLELMAKCEGDTDGFTSAGINAIIAPAAAAAIPNVKVTVREDGSWEYTSNLSGSVYNTYFKPIGTLTLSGLFSDGFLPNLSDISGKLVLTTGYAEGVEAIDGFGNLPSGELELGGSFRLIVAAGHTNNLSIGANGKRAVVTMKDNAKLVSVNKRYNHSAQPRSLYVGAEDNSRGILVVEDNAVFSNKLEIASGTSGSVGSVYQRGGRVVSPRSSADMSWSNSSGSPNQSFYEITDGYFEVGYWTRQAFTRNSVGIVYQHGGNVTLTGQMRFIPCIRGTGVVYQTSGVWNGGNGENSFGYGEWSSWEPGGFCNWTITGQGTKYKSSNLIRLAHHDKSVHILNVNDGARLEITQLTASQTNTSYGIVNFNGGVFAPSAETVLGNRDNTGSDGQPTVYIHRGGMTFDSSRGNNKNLEVCASLLAPTGKGVKSIAMPATLPSGYIAPPLVVIEGDGIGATAVAEFDSTSKVVTGITITSPGCDYTTARAYFCHGGPDAGNDYVECGAVTLEDNASGGLTKIGAGGLKFYNCEPTYTGVTYVAGGTMYTMGSNENKSKVLKNTPVRIAKGAELNLYWHATVVKALGGAGICYNQGPTSTGELFYTKDEVADGGLTFSNTDAATRGATGRLTLNANTVVKVGGLNELDHTKTYPLVTCTDALTVSGGLTLEGDNPERWRLVTTSKVLSLRPIGGMVILIR